ncbi:site-specific DNA-methyltransferase [bacterium]|jgi:DNA modification methylase|nr:site-specific DNA-methyltransferase [bacterium]
MAEIKIENVEIDKLKPAPYNPRRWETKAIEQLTESIKRFGMIDPIIVNNAPKRKGVVIGGHFRLKIAQDLGFKTVPVVYINIPDLKKEKELNLRLNKNTGDWDWNLLSEFEMSMLKDIGFESKDLDKLFGEDIQNEENLDPEEMYSGIGIPESKLGEVYEIGNHRVMCGDATNPEHIKKLMAGEQADMVFTDPPYNVDYQGGMGGDGDKHNREGILNDKMNKNDFYEFLFKSVKNLIENCKGAFYICMGSSEIDTLKTAFVEGGGHFSSFIIWAKNTFTLSRSDWQSQYEPMLYGWPNNIVNHYFAGWRDQGNVWEDLEVLKPSYDGGKTTIKLGEYHLELDGLITGKVINKKDQTDIWNEKKPSKSKEHPTMKPVKLVAKAIKASSIRDQIVLDTFGGSGSTLIACEELGRKCYMMELDPKYVDVIRKRYSNFINNQKKQEKKEIKK